MRDDFGRCRCPGCGHPIPLPRLTTAMFQIVIQVLEANNHNRTETARALGMPLRTLRNWIRMFRDVGFDVPSAPGRWPVKTEEFVDRWVR